MSWRSARSSACRRELPLQFHTDSCEAWRHDAEAQEARLRRPARVPLQPAFEGTSPVKSESEYAHRVEISTLHKVLAILRAAIRWGQAQTPPLIDKSPFHRFGVRLNTKAETVRDRRISREEEKRLLDAALFMNTWEHKYVGPLMHDRIIGALELCCRLGEMLVIQNKRVDWDTHTIGIPGQSTKDKENRRIPFDPNGRLAALLSRRSKLGPNVFVFGTENGEYVGSFKTAWESLLLIANGHDSKRAKPGARVDRVKLHQIDLHWHDLRHEGACRLLADGVDIRIIQVDARSRKRAADAALFEHDRRGVAQRPGGQLETTSAKGGRGRPECVTKCHTGVTRPFEKWRARPAFALRATARSDGLPAVARVRSSPSGGWRARQDSNLRPSA